MTDINLEESLKKSALSIAPVIFPNAMALVDFIYNTIKGDHYQMARSLQILASNIEFIGNTQNETINNVLSKIEKVYSKPARMLINNSLSAYGIVIATNTAMPILGFGITLASTLYEVNRAASENQKINESIEKLEWTQRALLTKSFRDEMVSILGIDNRIIDQISNKTIKPYLSKMDLKNAPENIFDQKSDNDLDNLINKKTLNHGKLKKDFQKELDSKIDGRELEYLKEQYLAEKQLFNTLKTLSGNAAFQEESNSLLCSKNEQKDMLKTIIESGIECKLTKEELKQLNLIDQKIEKVKETISSTNSSQKEHKLLESLVKEKSQIEESPYLRQLNEEQLKRWAELDTKILNGEEWIKERLTKEINLEEGQQGKFKEKDNSYFSNVWRTLNPFGKYGLKNNKNDLLSIKRKLCNDNIDLINGLQSVVGNITNKLSDKNEELNQKNQNALLDELKKENDKLDRLKEDQRNQRAYIFSKPVKKTMMHHISRKWDKFISYFAKNNKPETESGSGKLDNRDSSQIQENLELKNQASKMFEKIIHDGTIGANGNIDNIPPQSQTKPSRYYKPRI